MRALLDANVYISHLLAPDAATPPILAVSAALDGAFTLLLTAGVVAEVRRKTATKPYLARRISLEDVDRLVRSLYGIATIVPEIDPPFPQIGRDRKDDYLFAHALLGRADYLVAGDNGVQKVERVGDVRIVSPADFLDLLRESDRQT